MKQPRHPLCVEAKAELAQERYANYMMSRPPAYGIDPIADFWFDHAYPVSMPARRAKLPRADDGLLDARALAAKLGVHVSWVYEAKRQGKIPFVMIGRYPRFDYVEVLAKLEKAKGG